MTVLPGLRRRFMYSESPSLGEERYSRRGTQRRIWKDMKINTHRQHGRIVQSHHRILCNNSNCRRSSLLSSPTLSLTRSLSLFSSSHAASLFLPLSEPVSPHQLSLSCLSHRFKISLSLPPLALSAMPIPPPSLSFPPSRPPPFLLLLLLLLLCWPLSLSLSLARLLTRFLSFLSPLSLSLSLSLSVSVSHLLFSFPSPTRSFFSLYPQPSVLLLCPCLLISSVSSPVLLLLSHPDSLTPPPSYFSASVTPANFPLPSASNLMSQSLPPLSLSLSSSVLFLHVGELTGAAGTTGRGSEDVLSLSFSLSPFLSVSSPFQMCILVT